MIDLLARPLRPLVRLAVARGVLFTDLAARLKLLYVEAARETLKEAGDKETASRISVLTGLQRRDIGRLQETGPPDPVVNHFSRLVALWQSQLPFCDRNGKPRPLPRKGPAPSFDALAAEVRRDVHPRTQFETLLANGTIAHDPDTDMVSLVAEAHLPPGGSDAQLAYLADNLGDHAEAAVRNTQQDPPPFFERAVHYNALDDTAIKELEAYAREVQGDALAAINLKARELQSRSDKGQHRFRCGSYIFTRDEENTP